MRGGEGLVVLAQPHLVDDARTRAPEAHAILGTSRREKVVNLLVRLLGNREILDGAGVGLNEMVSVDGGRGCGAGKSRRHELKHSHLGCSVLEKRFEREGEGEGEIKEGERERLEDDAAVPAWQHGPGGA